MSESGGNDLLIDLFREEVRTNCQILTEGLIAQEQGGTSPQRLEAMMRAAHSIKGAARVVNVQPGVEVSHAMEDCFVRAQKAELTLSGGIVDVLLQCVDVLLGLAEAAGAGLAPWVAANQAQVAALVQCLAGLVEQGKAQPLPAPPSPAKMEDNGRPAEVKTAETDDVPVSAPPEERPSEEAASGSQTDDGVVRVKARSLTRLMGLAGESLVESRWLPPFSKALLQLKHLHDQLANSLEGLDEAAQTPSQQQRFTVLLGDARAELNACRELLSNRMEEFDRRMRNNDDLSTRLYREVISSRMRPFRDGVQGLPRLVRDLARQLGKKVQLDIVGEATEVDRDILEKLDAPLNHLLRNALDHAIEMPHERQAAGKPETGRLRVEATHTAGLLSITVSDNGRGIDLERLRRKIVERGHTTADVAQRLSDTELLDFLFLPGFSTTSQVTEISGRGVGLDVVHTMAQSVGGRVYIHTEPGRGTSFQIQLPVTLSVLRAVVVDIAGEPYAFPHNRIDRVIRIARDDLRSLENRQYVQVDGQNVGVVMGRQVLQLGPEKGDSPHLCEAPSGPFRQMGTVPFFRTSVFQPSDDLLVVLFSDRSATYGLVVDRLLGEQDLVVRPLDRRLGKVPNLHAAAILDDGSPVLIVDPDDLRRSIEKLLQGGRLQQAGSRSAQREGRLRKRVLVVDDSITVREVERQLLANQGYLVEVAVDGMEGWNLAREARFDLVITDIDMPRLNGIELVRRMKADLRLQNLPVVIVSYKDREEDRLRGLEAGANYYLAKSSFHDETLVQVVRELIGDAEG